MAFECDERAAVEVYLATLIAELIRGVGGRPKSDAVHRARQVLIGRGWEAGNEVDSILFQGWDPEEDYHQIEWPRVENVDLEPDNAGGAEATINRCIWALCRSRGLKS